MNKQDILQAAFEVWGRDMYSTTSLGDISQALGVSKPALYRHYRDKASLVDAMFDDFYDRYAAVFKDAAQGAATIKDRQEQFLYILGRITEYLARNKNDFIFLIARILTDMQPERNHAAELQSRGIVLSDFCSFKDASSFTSLHLLSSTSFYLLASFHTRCGPAATTPTNDEIHTLVKQLMLRIRTGLNLKAEAPACMDYAALEKAATVQLQEYAVENDLFKGIAAAVAEAGPWKASMELVASKAGLSKSGLYAHFKSKQDMLQQLFMREFDKIAELIQSKTAYSDKAHEKLYLIIIALETYLRSRPEIMASLDWIRIQHVDLGTAIPARMYDMFKLKLETACPEDTGLPPEELAPWVMFLVVGLLMKDSQSKEVLPPHAGMRSLYQYVIRGMEGWK